MAIRGHGTIIFRCQNNENRALTDVYYILQLRSSIISIGQLDVRGSEVLIKDGVLRIRDREQRLLAKVKRSQNRLYLLDLKVEQPVCLATWHTEEPWLWHARFGHLSFDALGQLEKMVRGLPHTKHALYTRRRGKEELVIGVYVDDLIITGARTEDINSFKREMAARFLMSDLGALSYYLGIEVR